MNIQSNKWTKIIISSTLLALILINPSISTTIDVELLEDKKVKELKYARFIVPIDRTGITGLVGGQPDKSNDGSTSIIEADPGDHDSYDSDEFLENDSKDHDLIAGFSFKDNSGILEYVYGIHVDSGDFSIFKVKVNNPDQKFEEVFDLDDSTDFESFG